MVKKNAVIPTFFMVRLVIPQCTLCTFQVTRLSRPSPSQPSAASIRPESAKEPAFRLWESHKPTMIGAPLYTTHVCFFWDDPCLHHCSFFTALITITSYFSSYYYFYYNDHRCGCNYGSCAGMASSFRLVDHEIISNLSQPTTQSPPAAQ